MTTPCPKHPYSRARAYEVIRRVEHERPHTKDTLRAYYCPRCGKWHLTSTPDKFKNEEAV